MKKVTRYIQQWESCGYSNGIPDEVPDVLMKKLLAPSYKAICIAILKNDMQFHSLGFPQVASQWYGALKKIELEQKGVIKQLSLI